MQPVLGNHRFMEDQLALPRDAQIELIIFGTLHALIENARYRQCGTSMHHRAWCLDEIVHQQRQIMIAPNSALARVAKRGSVYPDISMLAHSHRKLRMLFKQPYPGFDSFW